LKASQGGFDVVEDMLKELAAEAKKTIRIDLTETFKEIRRMMQEKVSGPF